MKIVVQASVEEAKQLFEKYADAEIIVQLHSDDSQPKKPDTKVVATAEPVKPQAALEKRTPIKVRHHKKAPHVKGKAKYGVRPWTPQEEALLTNWYMNPENHYSNGNMVPSSLEKFATSIRRTAGATSVKIVTSKLNRTLVRGPATKKNKKPSAVPAQKAPALKYPFPEMKSIKTAQSVIINLFKHLTAKEGNELKMIKDNTSSLGLETVQQWNDFVVESLQKGDEICRSLGVNSKLHLRRDGDLVWIGYGTKY